MKSTVKKFRNLKGLNSSSKRPITVYLAFSSDLDIKTEFERYIESDNLFNTTPAFDVICVIGKGYWYHISHYEDGRLRNITWYFQEAKEQLEILMLLVGIVNTLSNSLDNKRQLNFGNYFINDFNPIIVYQFDYARKTEISIENSNAYNNFLLAVQKGEFQKSINIINGIVSDNRQIAALLYDVGLTQKANGMFEPTVLYLSKALDLDDSFNYNVRFFHVRGLALYELQKFKEAILDFQEALRLNPQNADLHYCIGISFLQMWDMSSNEPLVKAIQSLNVCVTLRPNDVQALFQRGTAFNILGDFQNAKADYQKILGLEWNNKDALKGLAAVEHNIALRSKGDIHELSKFLDGNFA